jgi:5'(3')-deoxyribonucleotidase
MNNDLDRRDRAMACELPEAAYQQGTGGNTGSKNLQEELGERASSGSAGGRHLAIQAKTDFFGSQASFVGGVCSVGCHATGSEGTRPQPQSESDARIERTGPGRMMGIYGSLEVLLDMDGVLVDFVGAAIERLNKKLGRNITIKQLATDHQIWSIEKVYGISGNEFWEIVEEGHDLWCNLKPFLWADLLLAYCKTLGRVTICTSPSLSPNCAAQKTKWLVDHFDLNNTGLMIGGRKDLMARHNNLLIDDSPTNIEKFTSKGGKGILVPSNWNTPNLNYTMVKRAIEEGLRSYA